MGGFFVYMVRCSDGSLYTGYTVDIERRIRRHNSGRGSKYTASRRPVTLAYLERARTRRVAMRREAEVKQMTRTEKVAICKAQKGDLRLSSR